MRSAQSRGKHDAILRVSDPLQAPALALWALVIGIIGSLGCIVGMVQFLLCGHVSIRPGHDPVFGSSAMEMLLFLFVISVAFAFYGVAMVRRARRILKR